MTSKDERESAMLLKLNLGTLGTSAHGLQLHITITLTKSERLLDLDVLVVEETQIANLSKVRQGCDEI